MTKIVKKLRLKHNFKILLELAKISRSTYFYNAKSLEKTDKYHQIKLQIKDVFDENKGRYGYRRIHLELKNRGYKINHKTVLKLMKELKLSCKVRKKKYRSYKGDVGKIAPNILARNFKATKPNEKWVTDVTEFNIFGQKIYLSPILDLYSRDIISYTISYRPTLDMVTDMLENAFEKLPENYKLILHSDQGWHYQHKEYRRMLSERNIIQSMSRKANCLDNSVIENFFGHLKSELLYLQKFDSIKHFKDELVLYIDYYNNRRIKSKLKGLTPAKHRYQALLSA